MQELVAIAELGVKEHRGDEAKSGKPHGCDSRRG
jgi:hypothetical protein